MIFFDWILKKSRDPQAVSAFNALRHTSETPSSRGPLHAAPQAGMPRQPPAKHEVNSGSPQARSSIAQNRRTSAWILCAHSQHMCARGERLCPVGRCTCPHTQPKTTRTGHSQHKRPAQKRAPRPRKTAKPTAHRPPLPTTPPVRPRLDPKLETHTADPRAPWVPVPAKTPRRTPDQSETCFRVSDSFFESQIQIF